MSVNLLKYDNAWYNTGRGVFVRTAWYFVNAVFMQNALCPYSRLKIILLKLFGAKVGKGIVLKPCINIKYPWNLEIGDHSWVGEKVWLDSLTNIKIGNNVCISQGAYFCTGSHDWTDSAFGLIVKPIVVEDGVWIGARATILPGVNIATHSVVVAEAVMTKDTEAYMVYAGNPAVKIKERKIR